MCSPSWCWSWSRRVKDWQCSLHKYKRPVFVQHHHAALVLPVLTDGSEATIFSCSPSSKMTSSPLPITSVLAARVHFTLEARVELRSSIAFLGSSYEQRRWIWWLPHRPGPTLFTHGGSACNRPQRCYRSGGTTHRLCSPSELRPYLSAGYAHHPPWLCYHQKATVVLS